MKDYKEITEEQRDRLIAYEQGVECRIPVGFADTYSPSDDCYKTEGGQWYISEGGYQLAINRGFMW